MKAVTVARLTRFGGKVDFLVGGFLGGELGFSGWRDLAQRFFFIEHYRGIDRYVGCYRQGDKRGWGTGSFKAFGTPVSLSAPRYEGYIEDWMGMPD